MAERVAYVRVSSSSQGLDVQLEKMAKAGCNRVFQEKRSGRQAENRRELQACLEYVRAGDVLVVSRLDRLARSVLDLAKIADHLQRKDVALLVLDQGLNTATSEGKLTFNILSAMAEFETDIRAERQRDGIAMARQKGVKFGRRKALNPEQVNTLRRLRTEEGFTFGQLQDKYQVSRSTVLRALQTAAAA